MDYEPLVAGVNCARPIDIGALRQADADASDAASKADRAELACEELEVKLAERWAEYARCRIVAKKFRRAAEALRKEFEAEQVKIIDRAQPEYNAEMAAKGKI